MLLKHSLCGRSPFYPLLLLMKGCIALLLMTLYGSLAMAQDVYPMYYPADCETGEWGYVDADSNWVIRPQYSMLLYETNGGMYPVRLGSKWGFVGVSGEPLTDIVYDAVAYESDYQRACYAVNYAAVRKNGKWAFIDVQGKWVTEFKYDGVLLHRGRYEIRIKENGNTRHGHLDNEGNEVWDD